MHGLATRKIMRLGFIVLFGAMSVFHFPVMAFGTNAHSDAHAAMHSHHDTDPGDGGQPAGPIRCDGFACFLAVEPALIAERPLHAVLSGILRFAPAEFLLTASRQPDTPPPRLHG